ncbi:MAG TPA: YihA family ribosome biogenesis GTP-binding protein [Candidatus Faeciplasma pullistercoris]|uniref:Probable GTP-binding protein EngB n=1 Tax=Candidatus Faeciplasma pullistercoris TaxID=2840800 RepID=A0A9D1KLH3_9FIRM|nr:YihA family ribosome biogenesis GTP-binding protein [Candidatus Faeciplasma pullistercoris]
MEFQSAEFFASYGRFEQLPKPQKIEIAFAGRSNVGKSSLINRILGRRSLARVSSVPGKTQTINFYTLENIYLVDLPGYGYAKVAKTEKERWRELIGGYFADAERDLALVFCLVDMRHPPTADDLTMINFLIDSELPFCVVLTKADKLKKTEREKRLEALKSELPMYEQLTVIPFSSVTDEGVERMRSIIEEVSSDDGKAAE